MTKTCRDLMKRARRFVADSGCDEDDNEVNAARDALLAEMDAALAGNRFCKHDDCPYPDCLVDGVCPSQPTP